MPKSVLVCMSGGVDSTVAALLLRDEGYDVAGLTFWFWTPPGARTAREANRCCSIDAAELAARELGIPHEVVDASDAFRRLVVDDYLERAQRGETPNPCGRCNRLVRFALALEAAHHRGCDFIATGHHARLARGNEGVQLLRARDAGKDQTYFLYGLEQDVLSQLLLPVGEMPKAEVFAVARRAGLTAAELPESQDLCFMPSAGVAELYASSLEPGPIVDASGREMGRHRGLPHYTIGQRRGVGIASPQPLFVTGIDPDRNAVIVGPESALFHDALTARDAVYALGRPPQDGTELQAKIRYRTPASCATYGALPDRGFTLSFCQSQRAVTPGQLAVLYDGERLLGGGVIARASAGAVAPRVY